MRATSPVRTRERQQVETRIVASERVLSKSLLARAKRVAHHPLIEAVLEAVTGYVLLLDRRRQILSVNDAFIKAFGLTKPEDVLGLRLGDALGCDHARSSKDGCGSTANCRSCGAMLAQLTAYDTDEPIVGTCHMATRRKDENGCSEFAVRVKRVTLENTDYWVCVLVDVTVTRRREMLERLFLHDSRNVLMGLLGWGEWLQQVQPSEASEQIVSLTRRLAREIDDQQWLAQAALGTLQIQKQPCRIRHLLNAVLSVFSANECAKERQIEFGSRCAEEEIMTDERLLVRVLVNMVQNAVEATPTGGRIVLDVVKREVGYRFVVSNPGEVPEEVARQLFRTKISTKGEMRGLGTHALRLFGEGCLGGKVSFETDARQGTRFYFDLPQSQFVAGT